MSPSRSHASDARLRRASGGPAQRAGRHPAPSPWHDRATESRGSTGVKGAEPSVPLAKRVAAEGVGTALLLAAVVGSGIMGERLSGGNVAIALLANTLATGAALVALILTFGPISGAHFNPAVTLADAWQGGISWRLVPGYLAAQVAGA